MFCLFASQNNDIVAEWLRRQTRISSGNRSISVSFGSAGSNPADVVENFYLYLKYHSSIIPKGSLRLKQKEDCQGSWQQGSTKTWFGIQDETRGKKSSCRQSYYYVQTATALRRNQNSSKTTIDTRP